MSVKHWLAAFLSGLGGTRFWHSKNLTSKGASTSVWKRQRKLRPLAPEFLESRLVMSADALLYAAVTGTVPVTDSLLSPDQTVNTPINPTVEQAAVQGYLIQQNATIQITAPQSLIAFSDGHDFDGSPTGFNGLDGGFQDDDSTVSLANHWFLTPGVGGYSPDGSDLSGTDLPGADMPPADYSGFDSGQPGTDLPGSDTGGTDLPGADMPPADWGGNDWGGSDWGGGSGGGDGGGGDGGDTGGTTRNPITVRATDPEAWEGPFQETRLDQAEFTLTRSLVHDMQTVEVQLLGTARILEDYIVMGDNVFQNGDRLMIQFPIFEDSATFKILTRPDQDFEDPETVIARVLPRNGYDVTTQSSAEAKILDKTVDLDVRGIENLTLNETREDLPGADLRVNRDDDNQNGVEDRLEDYSGDFRENDIGRLELRSLLNSSSLKTFEGYVTLRFDESLTRIWKARRSGQLVSYDRVRSEETRFNLSELARTELYFDGLRTGTDLISATFHSTRGDRFTAQFDSVTARFWDVDLDIDSDNDAGFAPPSGIAWEEELEDHAYGIGKLVFPTAPGIIFTPVVFNPYPDIFDPAEDNLVRFDFSQNGESGLMRVWTVQVGNTVLRPYPVESGGHLITPGRTYTAQELKAAGWTNGFLYIDALYASSGHNTRVDVEGIRGKPDDRIRATVERIGMDRNRYEIGYDEVKYMIVQPDSFYPNLVHALRETSGRVLRHGLVSESVYGLKDLPHFGMQKLGLDELKRLGASADVRRWFEFPDVAGFKAALYRDWVSGEYIIAFAGTETYDDWVADGWQGAGYGHDQYSVAMEIGHQVKNLNIIRQAGLWTTGHSLGGGLASAAAIAGTLKSNTFNAAGVHENTLTLVNSIINDAPINRYPEIFGNFKLRSKELIHTWHLRWDILTFLQDNHSILPQVLGTRHELHSPWNPQLEHDGPRVIPMFRQLLASGINYPESKEYLSRALPGMGNQHSMVWCNYGMLVRHDKDGRIIWDIYGEDFYR